MAFSGAFVKPFRPAFDAGLAAGNGLLNSLVAYWPLDEASGNALDAHTNGLELSNVSGPGSAAGKINKARTSNGSQYFSRPDDALLSTGDVDFTLSGWIYLNATTNAGLVSRWNTAANLEYTLYYNHDDHSPNQRFAFAVSSNGTAYQELHATTFGVVSLNSWYHLVAWHDSVNNQIGISVNDVVDTIAYSAGVYNSNSPTQAMTVVNGIYTVTGRCDEIAFWKSAAGGGGVLTAAQRTALYNSGAGLAYSAFTT